MDHDAAALLRAVVGEGAAVEVEGGVLVNEHRAAVLLAAVAAEVARQDVQGLIPGIDGAAVFIGLVAGDLAALDLHIAVGVDGAAALGGGVCAEDAVADIERGILILAVPDGAAVGVGVVADEFAAGHGDVIVVVDGTAAVVGGVVCKAHALRHQLAVVVDRAAVFAGVVGDDGAFIQVDLAALIDKDRAAGVGGGIAAQGAAGHVEGAVDVERSAPAGLVAGEGAALHVEGRILADIDRAAVVGPAALDDAGAHAVPDGQIGRSLQREDVAGHVLLLANLAQGIAV